MFRVLRRFLIFFWSIFANFAGKGTEIPCGNHRNVIASGCPTCLPVFIESGKDATIANAFIEKGKQSGNLRGYGKLYIYVNQVRFLFLSF